MALYRLRALGTTVGESWSFTLHVSGSGGAEAVNDTWTTAYSGAWTGGLDAYVSDQVSTTSLSTVSIDESTDGQVTRVDGAVSLPGAVEGESLPFQCATAVSLVTALANRHGRGRFYLPPLAVSVMDAGRLSAAASTGIATAVSEMLGALGSGGLTLVIRNRVQHLSTNVTGGSLGDVIDTQRRRRNKLVEARTAVTV